MSGIFKVLIAAVLLCALCAGQQGYPPMAGDPSQEVGDSVDQQHGVARVSVLGGNVNLQRGDTADLVAAVVNAPVATQDRLQTGARSFAEIQLDSSSVVRLAENTDIGFAELQANRARVQFGAGTIIFRILRESSFQTDIETPSVALHPLGGADLRLTVLENGSTQINVRSGAVDLYGPSGSERLEAPRSVEVRAHNGGPEFEESASPPQDSLDDWSAGRDSQMMAAQSYRYTGGEMAGIGDLDANGSWVSSQYGPVWSPQTQNPGWAPYSDGQWVNEPYYGWTWVDAEPWGWAPFHYGRWFWNGGHGWCWWPGAQGYRRSWSPAYVGFFGFGGGRSGLGWVALAPHESFHSWWGGGDRGGLGYPGVRPGLYASYRNAAYRGGAVGTTLAGFGSFRGRFNAVPRDSFSGATVIQGRIPVDSGAYRFRFVDRPAMPNPRLAAAANRNYVQRSSFGQYAGRPNGGSAQGSERPVPQYRTPVTSGSSGAGWQHFGDPRPTPRAGPSGPGQSVRNFSGGGSGESGWHQFGQPERPRNFSQPSYRNFGNPQPSYRAPQGNSGQNREYRGGGGSGGHSNDGRGSGRHR